MTSPISELRAGDARLAPSTSAALGIAAIAGILAVFLRWYFVTHAQVMQPLNEDISWGDAMQHYRYAWNLVHHGVYSSDVPGQSRPRADAFRDPGYPVFLAALMWITDDFDKWYAITLLSQAVMGGMTVVCATLGLRHALPTKLLAFAAITMAVWPHLVAIPAYVLTENLSACLFAATALTLGEAARRQSIKLLALAGALLALTALTNAVLAPLFVPLALAFAWKGTFTRRQLLVLATVAVIPLVAWNIRNSTIPGPFSSSFRAKVNLVQGSWPTYHAASQLALRHDPIGLQTINAIDEEINAMRLRPALGLKLMSDRMARAPGTYFLWYLGKPTLLWGWEIALGSGDIYAYPTRNSPFMTNPVMKGIEAITYIFNGLLAVVALVGVAVVVAERNPSAIMLTFAVTAIWVTLVYGALQSDARYAIPFRTAEIALACTTIAAVIKRVGLRKDEADPLPTARGNA
ncbi:MAG: hypothetical protein AAGC76_14955 [Luteibacter sp.]|uniref:hypothetical protein n=1 Tax=Luteibacter sp. TaxID=1886636 RepID=UPI0028068967|nr:hypothetical protein [Luteibacter sp.]MDQ7997136.1 hypothetical protein [Luteibacter sp.]